MAALRRRASRPAAALAAGHAERGRRGRRPRSAVRAGPQLGALSGGQTRARSHCRFAPPLVHFIPASLTCSVSRFLKRQCDRTLGQTCGALAAGAAVQALSRLEHVDAGQCDAAPAPAFGFRGRGPNLGHLDRRQFWREARADNSGGPGGLTGPLRTPFQIPGALSRLTKTH